MTGGLAFCLAVWVQSLAHWFSVAVSQLGLFLAFLCWVGRKEGGGIGIKHTLPFSCPASPGLQALHL